MFATSWDSNVSDRTNQVFDVLVNAEQNTPVWRQPLCEVCLQSRKSLISQPFLLGFPNACQIASKCDPLFAAKNDPFDGAETGGAEPT